MTLKSCYSFIKKDGMIILECLVLHTLSMVMQHEKYKIFYWTGCP